jgi:hypothetical protein
MKVHKTLLALATAFSALSLSAQTNGFDIDMKKVTVDGTVETWKTDKAITFNDVKNFISNLVLN